MRAQASGDSWSRVRRWTIVGSSAAMFAPLLVPLLTGKVFTQYDLSWFHLPLRFLYWSALRAGDSILWTPALFSGFYLHGEGQVGELHPWHLVLYRFLPLDTAFNLEIVASYVLAFWGMSVLLRRFAFSRDASCLGALMFAFSGFNLLHLNHMNAVAICAHVPWVLLACDKMLRPSRAGERATGFLLAALAVGSQILLGYPQYVWMTLVAAGVFTACRARAVAGVVLVGGALLAAAAIGGVQLLPTFDLAGESMRAVLPIEWRLTFALTYSLHPLNLVQLWSPFAYPLRIYSPGEWMVHEFGLYDGAFATVAVAWVVTRLGALGSRRSMAAALLAMLGLSLVLALGGYGGLYWLIAHAPVVGTFRAPARHIFLVHLALSALVALAFDDLIAAGRAHLRPRALWPLMTIALLSVLTLATATFARDATQARFVNLAWSPPMRMLVGTAIVLLFVILTALAARGHAWALVALIPLTVLDLGFWGYRYVWSAPLEPIERIVQAASAPPDARRGDTLLPLIPSPYGNQLVMAGFRFSNGYAGLPPAARLPPTDPVALRLAGVSWRETGAGWLPVDDPMPRTRMISDAHVSTRPLEDLRVVDIRRTAVVAESIGPLTASPGTTSVSMDVPGRLVIDVAAGGRQLLVTTERFHPGWQARVDGLRSAAVRVNGDFLGSVVEPGRHRVEFTFAPASFRRGAWLSIGGIMIAAVAFAWLRRADAVRSPA